MNVAPGKHEIKMREGGENKNHKPLPASSVVDVEAK
jgi:hypothetical protein